MRFYISSSRTFAITAVLFVSAVFMFSNFGSSSAVTEYSGSQLSQHNPTPEPTPKVEKNKPGTPPNTSIANPQGPSTPTTQVGAVTNHAKVIENGITVGKPKQFDERTLTVLLQDLENKLARSQFPDPSALFAATGRFAGATATTTSAALSLRGPSTPSITTTTGSSSKDTTGSKNTDGSEQTITVGGTNPSTTNKTTASTEATTSGETTSTNQQVVTQGSFAPPTPTAPSQTSMFSFQPAFGISAQDLLAEQTSLFYQIVNLRLLLDRSISDRLDIKVEGNTTTTVKRDQFVVGFQISIDAAYKDAVAEAEITIAGTDVSLVSLMPQDKTYNVASVTKDAKAIDMGAVVQFLGIGATVGKTQESLYLVKDTDTVALERPATDGTVRFAWQFRPVLGRRTVEPGSRQVYALISIPEGVDHNLKVTATTKWRRYDRKTKTVKGSISDNAENEPFKETPFVVGYSSSNEFSLKPRISDMTWSDMGNGQVLVVVEGDGFTPDTTIVLGSSVLNAPDKGLTVANEKRLIVVTQGQLLAQSPSPPIIVGRYGTTEFVRSQCLDEPSRASESGNASTSGAANVALTPSPCGAPLHENNTPYSDLRLNTPVIKARDAQTFEVTLNVQATSPTVNIQDLFQRHPPVIVIGGKVFGLSDAPFIVRNLKGATPQANGSAELSFLAPTQLLVDFKNLTFKEFLWNQGELTTEFSIAGAFSASGVVTLGSNGEKTQLAITGGGFNKDVRVQVGDAVFGVDCTARTAGCLPGLKLNTNDGSATVITLSPTKAQIKDVKQILVMQGTAQPRSLALTPPPDKTPTAKIIAPTDPLSLDEGDSVLVKFEGANFESIQKVVFEGKELTSKPDDDDKAVRWVEVSTAVTGKKGKKRIVFVMKDDKEVPFTIIVR
jgi:hypothetical protein